MFLGEAQVCSWEKDRRRGAGRGAAEAVCFRSGAWDAEGSDVPLPSGEREMGSWQGLLTEGPGRSGWSHRKADGPASHRACGQPSRTRRFLTHSRIRSFVCSFVIEKKFSSSDRYRLQAPMWALNVHQGTEKNLRPQRAHILVGDADKKQNN